MGKRKDERRRITAIINTAIVDLETGRPVYWFDAEAHTSADELKRRAQMLRALVAEINRGHKEAGGSDGK